MLAAFALALAAPPEGVDQDDVGRWSDASARALAGPTGCWEFEGKVELVLAGYAPASRWTGSERRDHRTAGAFTGRIEAGKWTSFKYSADPLDPDDRDGNFDVPLFPMVGKIDPEVVERTDAEPEERGSSIRVEGGTGDAVNTLQRVLDGLDPDTATAASEWSDELGAIRLYEDFPLSDSVRDLVTVLTIFPGGGPATSVDVTFPKRVKVGDGLVKGTLLEPQMHLRGQVVDGETLPALESLSLGVAVLGFTVGYEQKLVYERATRCASAAPAPTPPPPP